MSQPNPASPRSARPNTRTRLPRPSPVASVGKALEILGSFTSRTPAWPLSALARRLGIPKSTAHNLLQTLRDHGFVHQDDHARVYRLGPRALEIGLAFARGSGLLSRVRPVLHRIAEQTGETVKFGVLANHEVLIVAAVESPRQLHTRADLGTRWPLHSSSLGKAILSALAPERAAAILTATGMSALTPATLQTPAEAEREFKQIRTRGFALDREENEPDVCCVAVPIVDPLEGTIAALSISGPRVRLRDARLAELGRLLIAAGRTIALDSPHVL